MPIIKITIRRAGIEKEKLIADVFFENEDEILVTLETGNQILIGRDEQGDSFVEIDENDIWDNSNRHYEQVPPAASKDITDNG